MKAMHSLLANSGSRANKAKFPFLEFIALFLIVLSNRIISSIADEHTTKVVAILDMDSRMGKEQKTAMQIAARNFNNGGSLNQTIAISFMDFKGGLLQTVSAAEKLIKGKQVQVIIIGVDDWQATTLVAQIGTKAKIPVLSLAASPVITPPYAFLQWPYLVQMAYNGTQQMHNLVAIIHAYHWRRVIVVSEDDPSAGDSGTLSLLTEALQENGSQMEYQLLLPHLESTTTTDYERKHAVQEAFAKFVEENCYSRVFIVVKVSLPLVSYLFEEANRRQLMGNDSVWIVTEDMTNVLPSLQDSTLLEMEGTLGFMTKFDNSTMPFQAFQARFEIEFSQNYPKESNEPGFLAFLAYDAITTITLAMGNISNTSDHAVFLREILQSNFTGLSGQIYFDQENNVVVEPPSTGIVNIVGANYQEILDLAAEDIEDDETAKALARKVTWPGNLKGVVPKGWKMPTQKKPMKIGVPVAHVYKNFVDYHGKNQSAHNHVLQRNVSKQNEAYSGFCIELFRQVLRKLDYDLPYEFTPYSGPYDELVHHVYNKSFDAVVGDVTILANRTELVEFTFPFEESGLSIVLPVVETNNHRSWIFLRPFTRRMWIVTVCVLVYTMLIVWVLEHRENADFRGPWTNQLSTAIWFAFSSLFFAQRETISNSLARVVVVTWLFIVLVITQSYTANLTSMLTNDRLNQTSIDMEMLQRSNAKVGYDNPSFVNRFLEDFFQFNQSNMVGIKGGFEDFNREFQARNIQAAFLEILYAQLFVSQYCNQYTITSPSYRYGGLAYAFPKGSPIAVDVSEAILTLTENGSLKELEKNWLNTSSECYVSTNDAVNYGEDQSSLTLKSFWSLFVISVSTTTICLLAFLISLYNSIWRRMTPA